MEEAGRNRSIRDRASGEEVLRILGQKLNLRLEDYVVLVASHTDKSPFALLVSIVLSQNTSDRNSIRAYLSLRSKIGVTLNEILNAREEEIAEAIKAAGLARRKARTLKKLARHIALAGGEKILIEMEPFKLREFLLSIPGVGKKTADVFLSLFRKAPVFAVDTHVARVAKKWGLAGEEADYDEISRKLLEFFGPKRSEEAHRLIIALGRIYCRARKPLCGGCPLLNICPWPAREGLNL